MRKNVKYTSKAKTTKITATSRVSAKIYDDFYTLEFTEERTIPDVAGVDLEKERKMLWDDVNFTVDTTMDETIKTVIANHKKK